MNEPSPKYERPPLVEVALSVQFDRLEASTLHLGLVWREFRGRFTRIEEKPELAAVYERFGPLRKHVPTVRLEDGLRHSLRLWFLNELGSELVQIQRDRFIRNWRKTDDEVVYPRYDSLRTSFVDDWDVFSEFVAKDIMETLTPNQCEVTYVNIIEDVNPGDIGQVLACFGDTDPESYLGAPESADFQFRFVVKNEDNEPWGRLHIVAAPAVRSKDSRPVIRLSLTARISPQTPDRRGLLAALDAGHESVVRGFTSMTTHKMHTLWGRQS